MLWLLLTFLGILVFSPKSLLYRVLMRDANSDPYAQSVVFFCLGGTCALLFSPFHGGFQYQISSRHLLLFLPLTVCATVGPVLLFKAYQRVDASEIAILQSSQKLWAVLGASRNTPWTYPFWPFATPLARCVSFLPTRWGETPLKSSLSGG